MTGCCQTSFLLLLSFIGSLHVCFGISLSRGVEDVPREVPGFALLLISVAAILLLAYVVIGCVCCPNRSIKALTYQNGFPVSRLNENLQFENGSEFAIFPPHSAVIDLQPVVCCPAAFEDKVTFEPLPDILPRRLSGQSAACSSRPAHFRSLLKNKVSLHDWFDDPNSNFPRDQLQYLKELGCGWFGRVVEGEAAHILNTEDKTAVVVKILREEASPSEHLHFLHEVRPYRDLSHPNVIRFLGRCLESDPFLLIMEHSTSDLKSYLIQHDNKEALVKNGSVLQMACNVAAGLRHLHENGYTHLDLAAHNCFVCPDLTVKIGDYGISFDRCRGDYYCLGDIALPIRWCSPEMLLCSDTTIETKEISREANIWAFGVVLWEIFEFGKLPYEELTNEEVLQKVLIERCTQLPLPSLDFPVKEEISMIMKECWKTAHLRPPMEKLENFLTRLYNDRHNLKTLETSFEERWNALQPKEVKSMDHVALKFDFSEKSGDSRNYSSDGERFSSFEVSFDLLAKNSQLSPSLRVLNGSIDELTENCLTSVSLGCEKSANDVASITSDLPQLEEDPIRPEQAIDDFDLAHSPSDASQHSTLQRLGANVPDGNSVEGSDANLLKDPLQETGSYVDRNVNNGLKAVDGNSNKLGSVFVNCSGSRKAFENLNTVLDIKNQNNDLLSAVPNIVIHESPLLLESFHDENENVVNDMGESSYRVRDIPKPFRFVFKEVSVPAETSHSCKMSTEGTSEGIAAPLHSNKARSGPFTSTPIKSTDLNCSNGFSHDNDDSGNVFNSTEKGDADTQDVSSTQAKPTLNSDRPTVSIHNSGDSVYYDAPSHKSETSLNDFLCMNAGTSLGQSGFMIAQSNFVDSNISKEVPEYPSDMLSLIENSFNHSLSEKSETVLADQLLPSGPEKSSTCAFLEAESSNVDSKCPLPTEPKRNVSETEKTELFPEDSLSLEYGEPVTPEVSINVSSYSYGNDCKSISMDSPLDHVKTSQETIHSPARSGLRASSEALESSNEQGSSHKHSRLDSSSSDLLDSYSDSFPHERENRMEDIGNFRLQKCGSHPVIQDFSSGNTDLFYNEDDLENDSESDAYKSKGALRLHPYDEVIVEDLETGEQTVITEGYSACDDYENSADSDDILKINIETDEAIIVDSSEALVGFVPSRSIELLQECEILPNLNSSFGVDDEKESSDSNNFDASNSASSSPAAHQSAASSPCESPDSTYPLHQPYRNFSLQNEVIEEEITDEILSPSSIHSTASFSSNEIFMGEEKMSEGSESFREQDACETSVMPSVDHFFEESDDDSKTDASYSECSPLNVCMNNAVNNMEYMNDIENNHLPKEHRDVMYSWQPTQSVRWHSDETLDVGGDDPVVLEGREILAGGVLETHGMSVKDFTTALNRLDVEDQLNRGVLDHLSVSQSPSPYSSVESSPCRDAYTPDFESDSEGSGTSCSSTSGSFECINNKFKNSVDVSRVPASDDDGSSSREQSPLKIFSKTWDCHATPTRGVLLTPEKKLSSMRKSVSFHEEDPQVVFEYPPASDSSEDGANESSLWNIDYQNYADWELQAGENEEIAEIEEVLEIEELDSEPYVRRPTFGSSQGPMLYSLTSGFSDDDMDFPDSSGAPSNSPEEGPLSEDEISELIRNQLNNLALEENRLKWMQDVLESQASEFACDRLQHDTVQALQDADGTIKETNREEIKEKEILNSHDPEKAPEKLSLSSVDASSPLTPDAPSSFTKEKEPSSFVDDVENPLDVELGSEKDCFLEMKDESQDSKSSPKEDVMKSLINFGGFAEDVCDVDYVTQVKSTIPEKHLFLVNPELQWELHKPIGTAEENTLSFSSALLETPDRNDADFPVLPNSDNGTFNHALSESLSFEISPLALEEGNKRPKHKAPSNDDSDHEILDSTRFESRTLVDVSSTNESNDVSSTNESNDVSSTNESNDVSSTNESNDVSSTNESNNKSAEFDSKELAAHDKMDGGNSDLRLHEHYQLKDESLRKNSYHQAETFQSLLLGNNVNEHTNEDLRTTDDIFLDSNRGSLIHLENSKFVNDSNILDATSKLLVETNSEDISPIAEHTSATSDVSSTGNGEDLGNCLLQEIENKIVPAKSGMIQCPDSVGGETNEVDDALPSEIQANCSMKRDNLEENTTDPSHEGLTDIGVLDITNSEISSNGTLKDSYSDEPKVGSASLPSKITMNSCVVHESALILGNEKLQPKDHIPKIVITPASESEFEDELEEYLRNRLELYHQPEAAEENFSVTSQYTVQPFEDVFGSYSIPGTSSDYTEAFNFEFDGGDFFDDLIDDYPNEVNPGHWEVADVPSMMEKSRNEDSKCDSSPLYYTTSDATHL